MKVRPAGSSLPIDEAMNNVKEFNTKKEFLDWLKDTWYAECFDLNTITSRYYCYDDRIGWDTYVVCADMKDYKQQAMVFTDFPFTELP